MFDNLNVEEIRYTNNDEMWNDEQWLEQAAYEEMCMSACERGICNG